MQLPDEPSIEVRPKKETAEPQGAIELVADRVGPLEVVANIEDHLASPRILNQANERAELFLYFRWTGSGAAVAGQLQIDRGREGVALGRSDIEEMASLVGAGRAQGEVVVGASIKSRLTGSAPVLIESVVGEVTALGGLDVRERDAIAWDLPPIDNALMGGHVDAVSLAFPQGWPPVRHPQKPPDGQDPTEESEDENPDKGPSSTPLGEPWRRAFVRQG